MSGGPPQLRIERDPHHLELLRALAHPVRLELLGVLSYRNISPSSFARRRKEPVGNVTYHFRYLEEAGCIELAETKPSKRGSVVSVYRRIKSVIFSERDWLLMPDEERQIVSSTILRDLVGRMTEALQTETFTKRPEVHITWQPVALDERGWKEVDEILTFAERRVEQAQVDSIERMRDSGEAGLEATVAFISFESPRNPSP